MYTVDDKDVVLRLKETPQPDVGALLPFVMSDEHTLLLSYIVR
jgi:hypothetical protein